MEAIATTTKTKAQLLAEIKGLNKIIEQLNERLKTRTEELSQAGSEKVDLMRELAVEREAHAETKKALKVSDARVAAAVETASEGCLAAGIASRMVSRLMDQNDLLTRDMTRIVEGRRR